MDIDSTGNHDARPRRRTVAVLIDQLDHFTGGFESELRAALQRAFEKLDLNLLVVAGHPFDAPDTTGKARNGVYELINHHSVDGVIFVSVPLTVFTGPAGVEREVDRLRPLPVCSLGLAVPGVPSVVFDDESAMRDLVEHVVHVHGRRRIAFIGGPEHNVDASHRHSVTENLLARHGIPLERWHVARAQFTVESGAQAMSDLLDGHRDFDAVIAANDGMALGAIEMLQSRGIRVPQDVIVTGFDDLPLARLANPPLSTVRQPFEHMTALAARIVLDQIEGGVVPECTVLPAEFMVRASCGCDSASRASATPPGRFVLERFLSKHDERLEAGLDAVLRAHPPGSARRLLAALAAELGGMRGAFREVLELSFRDLGPRYELYDDLDLALERLWDELRFCAPELSDLFQSCRHLVHIASVRAQARWALEMEATYRRLLKTGENLSAAFDDAALKRALAEELPHVPTKNAYVSLYAGDDGHSLETYFSLIEGESRPEAGGSFEAQYLLPPGAFPADRRHTAFALPLTSEAHRWGVLVIEVGSPFGVCQMLAEQISASLNTLALHREIVRRTALHAKTVQEKLAATARMQSLSTLAGGVAHDLNNALGPLVALPEAMLVELDEIRKSPGCDDSELRADIRAIQSTAVRASQTIKDLLTLGRAGRMSREVADLNPIVERCIEGERMRLLPRHRSTLALRVRLASEPLPVSASESHVARALSNIVQNAIDAMNGRGEVTVTLARRLVSEPLALYETIEPGEYATLVVQDDGPGIPQEVLPRLFEPFFSTKRTGEYSGSGLGLAIVHSVVKEHQGYLDVQAAEGRGTTFTFFFPVATAVPVPVRSRSQAPRGSARILVVDDEPLQLHTARRILEQLGYEVSTTSSGQNALERFGDARRSGVDASPFDLVILDMMLGEGQDGLEILRCVRELFPAQRGLLMSGYAPAERGDLATQQGFGWLSKPFSADSLGRAVRAVLALDKTQPGAPDARKEQP
jgi:DNA-binding LacI/PurR family transcriptional regulator/signal transduction histidine kinase/ActR/RegA family two-component response regulator